MIALQAIPAAAADLPEIHVGACQVMPDITPEEFAALKRHDRIVLAVRLRQLRACVKATLETCEEMDREGGR